MSVKIKGSVLKSRLSFVEQHFGKEAGQKVLSTLPAGDRALFEGLLTSVGWFDFEVGKRLDDAIVKVLAGGNSSFFEELGKASADKNLATVHKHFLAPGDPQGFLAKTSTIYSFYYEGGRRTYEQTGPKSGVMTTIDAETFSAPDCLTVIGWYKRALQMCGATGVKMVEEECRAKGGKVCRYKISWN